MPSIVWTSGHQWGVEGVSKGSRGSLFMGRGVTFYGPLAGTGGFHGFRQRNQANVADGSAGGGEDKQVKAATGEGARATTGRTLAAAELAARGVSKQVKGAAGVALQSTGKQIIIFC